MVHEMTAFLAFAFALGLIVLSFVFSSWRLLSMGVVCLAGILSVVKS